MKVKTACPLDCWDACSIIAEVEDGVVTRLDGDVNHPITRGTLCGKGRGLLQRTYSKDRIVHPMKQTSEGWQRISWQQALDEIAERLRHTLRTVGHHSILHAFDYGSGTLLKNLNQRFFYLLGGCSETVGSLCWEAGIEAQRYDFGLAQGHEPSDLHNAGAVVAWGRNIPSTNMHMMPFLKEAQARGGRIVVVNPLPTALDNRADLVLRPRPGSDGALALGVLRICRDRGWLHNDFLEAHTVGWEDLSAYLDAFDLVRVTDETDVSGEQVVQLAEIFGTLRPVATVLGLGMQRYPGGGNTIRAIDALAAATGHIGVSGGGVHYANRGVSKFLSSEAIAPKAGLPIRKFARGSQADEILSANPPIDVMFVTRTNPLVQVPDAGKLARAYGTIGTTIVIDQFMTKTAEMADYFLPCTTVLEDEDVLTTSMWHSYMTSIRPVVDPVGESKPDWQIFAELADRLGFGDDMRRPTQEWIRMAFGNGGTALEAGLRQEGTVRLPTAAVPWADGQFATPSGKFEFVSATAMREGHPGHAVFIPGHGTKQMDQDSVQGNVQYPYILLTIHPRLSENSQHKDFPNVPEHPDVEIPQVLADELGFAAGELVKVWNDQAALTARVKVVSTGHPRTIRIDSGWWGQGITINHLTKGYMADFGQQTAQYDCVCNMARLG